MVDLNTASDAAGEVIRHLRALEARGSTRLVAQLIDSLMSESSGQMEAVRNAAANGDRDRLYRAAHSLQGSVAVAGGDSVARLCAELVKTARSGSFEQIDALVGPVALGIDAIRKALVSWTEKKGRDDASATAETSSRPPAPPQTRAHHRRRRRDARITQTLVESIGTTSSWLATASKGWPNFSWASIWCCSTS